MTSVQRHGARRRRPVDYAGVRGIRPADRAHLGGALRAAAGPTRPGSASAARSARRSSRWAR
ncbi:MAG: hypothetical protein M0C28_16210 [Candidatus Moduliflexus flocculans]|nr:hypothetical protein [Candidatus Moduliflexus flocculans]